MTCWTKEKELELINQLQDEYVDELIQKMQSTEPTEAAMKFINFTSPTGTGKTKMIAKLINKLSDDFFIITTLSKGQLNRQVAESIQNDCAFDNYIVFGAASLKTNTILTEKDIINLLPDDKMVYWIRDEGHISTNKWSKVLEDRCAKIINFSATNKEDGGIVCDFSNTLMLRTVNQNTGNIQDALNKLREIKDIHKGITAYNPCALFRVMSDMTEKNVIKECELAGFKYITLVDNNNYKMTELCEDNNEYDVIINKQKLTEGIDIRRAHVLWIENQPSNIATTIQAIGRCRRNALLWRDDIDILSSENKTLLEKTRECFVFYNVENMKIDIDETGELALAFCPLISVERLKTNYFVYVQNGRMLNGLTVSELIGCSGFYQVLKDKQTGFNRVNNPDLYKEIRISHSVNYKQIISLAQILSNPSSDYCINFLNACQLNKFGKIVVSKSKKSALCYSNIFYPWGYATAEKIRHGTKRWKEKEIDQRTENNSNLEAVIDDKDFYGYFYFYLDSEFKTVVVLRQKEFEKFATLVKNGADEQLLTRALLLWRVQSQNITINPMLYHNELLGLLSYDKYQTVKRRDEKCGQTFEWVAQKSITKNITQYTKLSKYIEQQYNSEISLAKDSLYSGVNEFDFTKKMNSCLGYCAEYYTKFLLYGLSYLKPKYSVCTTSDDRKLWEKYFGMGLDITVDPVDAVRLCMLKYRSMMQETYLNLSGQRLPGFSYKQLHENEMINFINAVVSLGTKASKFCQSKVNAKNSAKISPVLQTSAFVGLVDLMDFETIIDIKCTNHIDINMIKQVLAYQFLSRFRSDVNIKRVIVYDAVADKAIEIPISEENQQKFV